MLINLEDVGNCGFINKKTIEYSEVICTGIITEIFTEKREENISKTNIPKHINQDSIKFEFKPDNPQLKKTITIKGDWCIAKILVGDVLKGEKVPKEINLRWFYPITDPNGIYLDTFIPGCPFYLFFLKKESQSFYSLTNYSNSSIPLPFVFSYKPKTTEPAEELKKFLLQVLQKDGKQFPESVFYTLGQLSISQSELISLYKDLTWKIKPDVIGYVLEKRIELGDTSVLDDIVKLSQDARYVNSVYINTSKKLKLSSPENIPKLIILLSSKNKTFKEGAIMALSDIKDKSIIPIFIKSLDDQDDFVKFRAVIGLTNILGAMKKEGKFIPCPLKNPNENGCVDLWKNWWETEGKKKYEKEVQ